MLLRKLVDVSRERSISIRSHRSIPLRRVRVSDCPARAPLADANVADGVVGRLPLGERSFQNAKLSGNLGGGMSSLPHSGSGSVGAPY
jgi:hypothetical protein